MAIDLRPMTTNPYVGLESRTPKRQSFIRAALSQKKRKSRDNQVLRPDPFRHGDPNPLGCHPYFSDKHPDYIHRPHTVRRPLSFPVFSATTGSGRLSSYSQDDLDAYRAQGFVPRLMRIDSLVAIFEFFDRNTLTRAMANSPNMAARKPPEKTAPEKKPPAPAPALVQRNSDISLQDFIKGHEAASAQRTKQEKRNHQNTNPAQFPSPLKEVSRPSPSLRTAVDSEPSVEHFSNSGLPKGWKATHDRFIAYLDTHAPLTSEGAIAFREWKVPQHTIDQIVCLLKERFLRFRDIPIPAWAIERRLEILDYRDNNYFDMPYGCYSLEVWGKGI